MLRKFADPSASATRPASATTKPSSLVSIWLAGTGVPACLPSASFRSVSVSTVNLPRFGQPLPAGGLVMEIRSAPRNTSVSSSKLRSEEHTSELQSRQYLVCRLLLEKKKIYTSLYGTA